MSRRRCNEKKVFLGLIRGAVGRLFSSVSHQQAADRRTGGVTQVNLSPVCSETVRLDGARRPEPPFCSICQL